MPLPDFTTEWQARAVAAIVPASAQPAARHGFDLTISGVIEYEGEMDQTTTTYLTATVTGYDDEGTLLWSHNREYEGSQAVTALLTDLARQQDGDDERRAAADELSALGQEMSRTSYGTWLNHTSGQATVRAQIESALGDRIGEFDVDAIERDYRAAIDLILPSTITLAGDEFYGPHPQPDSAADDIRDTLRVLNGDRFWGIVAKHDRGDQ